MKKLNIYRIIWVSCMFLLLIVILIMVMDYKINYQYNNDNKNLIEKSLYIYKCDDEICTSLVEDKTKELLSTYNCMYKDCPKYKEKIGEKYILLESIDKLLELFDYNEGEVISGGYDSYKFIDNNYIIVSKKNKYGIINLVDDIIVPVTYDSVGAIDENGNLAGYENEKIIVSKNKKYGVINYKTGTIIEGLNYNTMEEVLDLLKQND